MAESSEVSSTAPTEQTSLSRKLLTLVAVFGKFGALTFGGGYAIVAMMEDEIVHRRHWMTSEELMDLIAIGESTPGPIAVNTATFIGYKLAGIIGSLVAVLALVLPAWLIIVLISGCYLTLRDNVWIAAALSGIRIAAIVLILQACLRMGSKLKRNGFNAIMLTSAFYLTAFPSLNAFYVIIGALLIGLIWHGIRPRYLLPKQKETP
jgi:chromate transporter